MNKLKILFASLMTSMLMLVPVVALAQGVPNISEQLCNGSSNSSDGNCDADTSQGQIESLVTTVITIFSWVVGVISVIMIIYGGFRYVTSGGGTGIEDAKKIIMYAIIGLVVVAFAQVIVHFVIGSVGGSTT